MQRGHVSSILASSVLQGMSDGFACTASWLYADIHK